LTNVVPKPYGAFETIRVVDGRPQRLPAHLARLRRTARALGLSLPPATDLAAAIRQRAGALPAGVLALRVTQTRETDSLQFAQRPVPYRGDERWRLITVADPRPPNAPGVRFKVTDRAALDHARSVARARGADDALLVSASGWLGEGPAWNLFWITAGALYTPALACGALPGVTRSALLRAAPALGLERQVGRFRPTALWRADAVFATNALGLAIAVASVDGRAVGSAEGFALVSRVREWLEAHG
jgi:branched-subunit amino acid aminotransferase/4-amino-4-deoxychorismate lyase